MKNITCLLLWLGLIGLCACRNEQSGLKTGDTSLKKYSQQLEFIVQVDVKVLSDDRFQLFYIDRINGGSFDEEKKVVSYIQGKNAYQLVKFKLPINTIPFNFRIDVGEKGMETRIHIREVRLIFNNKSIDINSKEFLRFFEPNIYLMKEDKNYKRIIINEKYDPFFKATPLLNKKMELELFSDIKL